MPCPKVQLLNQLFFGVSTHCQSVAYILFSFIFPAQNDSFLFHIKHLIDFRKLPITNNCFSRVCKLRTINIPTTEKIKHTQEIFAFSKIQFKSERVKILQNNGKQIYSPVFNIAQNVG